MSSNIKLMNKYIIFTSFMSFFACVSIYGLVNSGNIEKKLQKMDWVKEGVEMFLVAMALLVLIFSVTMILILIIAKYFYHAY